MGREIFENLLFAARLVDRQLGGALDAANLFHYPRALVQQFQQAQIQRVDRHAILFERPQRFFRRHSGIGPPACPAPISKPCFSSRTNDSNWISSDVLSRFCSISLTMALPTTTA